MRLIMFAGVLVTLGPVVAAAAPATAPQPGPVPIVKSAPVRSARIVRAKRVTPKAVRRAIPRNTSDGSATSAMQ